MTFYDTSVLVAAVQEQHERHKAAGAALRAAEKNPSACSAHTLVELYSTLTRMPSARRMSAADAFAVVNLIASRLTCVALNRAEYLRFLSTSAGQATAGGAIYDALHLQCARKVEATMILTLNVRDFKRVAPDLASRIHEP